MATEVIKIQLHKFMRAGHKRHHWQVMLHWDGCGSVPLTGELTRKREAVKEYLRYKRIATNNWGKVCCHGFFPMLESLKGCLDDSYKKCFKEA